MSTSGNAIYLQDPSMSAQSVAYYSRGTYSGAGTATLDASNNRFAIVHASYALFDFGAKSSHATLNVYSNITFNGLVLRNGDASYIVVGFKPNAYYPNTKTFIIGANTQATLTNHYVSGTDFFNLFDALPPLADGYLNAGKIKVQTIGGTLTEYAVTRLVKDGNGINFYTGSGIVRVDKFVEGTSTGVYEHLEVSEAITFQTVPDGVEVKSVLPWGTLAEATENVSIGTTDSRFESAYLIYLDVLNNALITGTLTVNGAATVASINTGLGAFEIGQNLRTTDIVTFAGYKFGNVHTQTIASSSVTNANITKTIGAINAGEIHKITINTQTLINTGGTSYYIRIYAPSGTYMLYKGELITGGILLIEVGGNANTTYTYSGVIMLWRIQ